MNTKADTIEDLLNVYGLTLGGAIKSEIEKEVESLEFDLKAMQTRESMVEEYNAVLSEYIAKKESYMDSILNDIDVYQKDNSGIVDEIGSVLLDAPMNDLLTLDSRYKVNTKYVNELLSAMNDYKLDYGYRNVAVDTSDVESKLTEARSLYVGSIDAYTLGKVKDIDFVLDSERVVNSKYGYRVDPINREKIKFHAGTDYKALSGQDIHALFNGQVISCGWSETIGNFVVVQSGENVKYMVCHCSDILVTDGQYVMQGDVIAHVGSTGTRCTGPHLHLALYLNGVTYDVDALFR